MAKLYFRYGTMGSAKTLNLLAVAHNYQQQNKPVIVLKPKLDNRFGETQVKSRAGLAKEADVLITDDIILDGKIPKGTACILVDEAQFLAPGIIDQLREVATNRHIPVICYGLRTDFKARLFPGTQRLMELADTLEEVKTTCHFCHKKATMNVKFGANLEDSPMIDLGAEDKYLPACYTCYRQHQKTSQKTASYTESVADLV